MSEIKIKRIVDVSVIGEVKDLIGILEKLDPEDIFTLESGNNETASEHLANVLVGEGYKAIFGDGVKVEEKPKKVKAKKKRDPDAPKKLTKKRIAALQEEYETAVTAGESPGAVMSQLANKHGYDMEKLRKAFDKRWD